VKLTVFRNEREAVLGAADALAAAVRGTPALVLGLAAGRTPIPVYRQLVAMHERGRLDLSAVSTFNLDEFWRLPPDHPGSHHAHMVRHLFGHVGIQRSRIGFLDGMAADADAECARYERAVAEAGGIDVQLLGIGADGQVGFIEPAGALHARAHRVRLKPQTRRANATFFGNDPALVPEEALSMGIGTILGARRVIVVATGRGKGRAVERTVAGPLTTRVPASLLQLHANVEVVVDEAAAERLTESQRGRA
jgi:glucosamine-6-phosphate deaminase